MPIPNSPEEVTILEQPGLFLWCQTQTSYTINGQCWLLYPYRHLPVRLSRQHLPVVCVLTTEHVVICNQ